MKLDALKWGTAAEHKIGDISRPEGDFFLASKETEDHWIGEWVTGYGFINAKFPKATSRDLTNEERAYMATQVRVFG